jgi:hypothetical protein
MARSVPESFGYGQMEWSNQQALLTIQMDVTVL